MRKTIVSLALSGILAFAGERALISDDYSNYFSTAKEIPLNTVINGSIETAGDIDIFKFTLDKDDGVGVYLVSNGNDNAHINLIEKSVVDTALKYVNENNWDIKSEVEGDLKKVLDFHTYSEKTETLNMSKGDYYIVIIPEFDSTTSYTFRIESTENTGNVTLDQVTLEYCKTHLSECGIEVNSSLKYTQSDLDNAKQQAKDELKLTKDRVDSLGNGWSLIGSCQSEEDKTIFNSASSVWVYENGEWNNSPTEIKAFSGVWVRK